MNQDTNAETPRDIAAHAIATSARYGKPVVLAYSEPVAAALFAECLELIGSTEQQDYVGRDWTVTLQRRAKN